MTGFANRNNTITMQKIKGVRYSPLSPWELATAIALGSADAPQTDHAVCSVLTDSDPTQQHQHMFEYSLS